MDAYAEFIAQKSLEAPPAGLIGDIILPDCLKAFQADITRWALRRGRAAVFAGTGLGKTIMQLVWADEIAKVTGEKILILTPLAVAQQTCAEAEKFGIAGVAYAPTQWDVRPETRIVITNYDRFHHFDVNSFAAIVLDESSIIKSHDSKTRKHLIEACREVRYKLCCTATPAPNDWVELGNHAEFLGVMSEKEMLAMFFVHDGSVRAHGDSEWRLKGHSETAFWKWLASWSVMIRSPADLGYAEPGYVLPPLTRHQIIVPVEYKPTDGMLFPMEARTMSERLGARRESVELRAKACYELINENQRTIQRVQSSVSREAQREASSTSVGVVSGKQGIDRSRASKKIHESLPRGASREMDSEPSATGQDKRSQEGAICDGRGVQRENQSHGEKMATGESSPSEGSTFKEIQHHAGNDEGDDGETRSCLRDMRGDEYSRSESFSSDRSLSRDREVQGDSLREMQQGDRSVSGQSKALGECREIPKEKWIIWVALNKEQDEMEKLFKGKCVSIRGTDSYEEKITREIKWRQGDIPIIITKPSMFGHGLNWQHCSSMIFLGMNDSFEQLYQAIRRCWRFGQRNPVNVYMIASELEGAVVANVEAKEAAFEKMQASMAEHMRDLTRTAMKMGRVQQSSYKADKRMEVPSWLI